MYRRAASPLYPGAVPSLSSLTLGTKTTADSDVMHQQGCCGALYCRSESPMSKMAETLPDVKLNSFEEEGVIPTGADAKSSKTTENGKLNTASMQAEDEGRDIKEEAVRGGDDKEVGREASASSVPFIVNSSVSTKIDDLECQLEELKKRSSKSHLLPWR